VIGDYVERYMYRWIDLDIGAAEISQLGWLDDDQSKSLRVGRWLD
jgi:hypothetical protein